jgi:NAD(P)-dependent dehydrogenase (short-subunit alcohol dehydrogenase family)
MSNLDFKGRVAIVTGAGNGLGRQHALALAARGAKVLVNDLGAARDGSGGSVSAAQAVVDEIKAAGGQAIANGASVTDFEAVQAMVRQAVDAWGRVDILVNNAGIAGGAPLESVDEATLEKVFAVNFYGTVGMTKAVWPQMQARGWGRVVNTVSEAAFASRISGASSLGYGAAKAAVWSATLSMAKEGQPHGITVNAISPGAFTRMNEAMFAASPPPAGLDLDPRHVALVMGWLVSEEAGDVTGRIVHAAGGHHREYVTERRAGTELVLRIETALGRAGAS